MQLTQDSNVPIYRQISDSFKEDILAGRIAEGAFLPSIRVLARELNVSVITTVKAYKTLQEEGVITPVCGKGFLVNGQNCEKLRRQHRERLNEGMQEIVHSAKLAGISEQELTEMMKKAIEKETRDKT